MSSSGIIMIIAVVVALVVGFISGYLFAMDFAYKTAHGELIVSDDDAKINLRIFSEFTYDDMMHSKMAIFKIKKGEKDEL